MATRTPPGMLVEGGDVGARHDPADGCGRPIAERPSTAPCRPAARAVERARRDNDVEQREPVAVVEPEPEAVRYRVERRRGSELEDAAHGQAVIGQRGEESPQLDERLRGRRTGGAQVRGIAGAVAVRIRAGWMDARAGAVAHVVRARIGVRRAGGGGGLRLQAPVQQAFAGGFGPSSHDSALPTTPSPQQSRPVPLRQPVKLDPAPLKTHVQDVGKPPHVTVARVSVPAIALPSVDAVPAKRAQVNDSGSPPVTVKTPVPGSMVPKSWVAAPCMSNVSEVPLWTIAVLEPPGGENSWWTIHAPVRSMAAARPAVSATSTQSTESATGTSAVHAVPPLTRKIDRRQASQAFQ